MNQKIELVTVGGSCAFPIVKNLWDFFAKKGTKTVFVSVGSSSSPQPDLDIGEMLGCPVHIFEPNLKKVAEWNEIKELLKTRKATETTSEFAKVALRKWLLPRNILIQDAMPSVYSGTITNMEEGNENSIKMVDILDNVKSICKTMDIPEEETHIDILKIDMEGHEKEILHAFMSKGFRPSILLVHWSNNPDENYDSMIAAGSLQMLGYALLGKEDNKFFYYFTDINYYEICEWTKINEKGENPLITTIKETIYPYSEKMMLRFGKSMDTPESLKTE